MDEKIEAYIDSLVTQILNTSNTATLAAEQKSDLAEQVKDRLYQLIFDTTMSMFSPEQMEALRQLPEDSLEMGQKMEEFAATVPNLAQILETKLNQEVETIKLNGLQPK